MSRSEESPDELTLIFPGHLNRTFDGLKRVVELPPGSHELRFRWKADANGHSEGAKFVVRHAVNRKAVLAQSTDLLGAEGWREEALSFRLEQRAFVELGVVREPFRRVRGSEQSSLSVSALSLRQTDTAANTVAAR